MCQSQIVCNQSVIAQRLHTMERKEDQRRKYQLCYECN